ncbi:hypothetical protein ACFLRU_05260 [Bacteroidota bacterium]
MKKHILYHAVLACLTLFATSCDLSYLDKDIDEDITWDGSVQIPAGHITYKLSDLFNELGVEDFNEDPSGNLSFTYSESLDGGANDAFDVDVPNKTITSSVGTPITAANLATIGESFPYTITAEIFNPSTSSFEPNPLIGSQTDSDQVVYDLALSQDLTGASFNGGTMSIEFNSTFDATVTLTIEIPSFTKKSDDAVYTETVVLNGAGTQTVNIPLNEYNGNFTHNGTAFDTTVNSVVINLDANFEFSAGNVLDATDAVSYSATLAGASTEVVYGDFGQEGFSVSSTSISLDFFENFGDGNITFASPEMKISATNDYGFPIGVDLSNITASNGNNAEDVTLTYTGDQSLANTLIIDGVANFGDAPNVNADKVLDKNNSNIDDLLSIKPTSINLNVSGTANPINGNPNENFYATSNSGLNVNLEITVPMDVKFENLSLDEVVDFDSAEDLDDLNGVTLTLKVDNKIPLTGKLDLLFLDSQGNELSPQPSINTTTLFEAAPVDGNGKSNGTKTTNSTIEFSDADINIMKSAKQISVVFTLDSPSGQDSVNLLGTDELTIYIGLIADAQITTEDN